MFSRIKLHPDSSSRLLIPTPLDIHHLDSLQLANSFPPSSTPIYLYSQPVRYSCLFSLPYLLPDCPMRVWQAPQPPSAWCAAFEFSTLASPESNEPFQVWFRDPNSDQFGPIAIRIRINMYWSTIFISEFRSKSCHALRTGLQRFSYNPQPLHLWSCLSSIFLSWWPRTTVYSFLRGCSWWDSILTYWP